ncbi:GNAT family acetyltransferase [Chromatiales bacterium (ex Bugula neritina AB1)]|nr:GNAT family acetyltransferase [Chromatiales bacterium (ex Bugula neritina AB1)]
MDRFVVRSFTTADTKRVILLWSECGLIRPWNDPELDIQRKLADGSDLFLVGELDGEIVSSVMGGYDGHRGWMNYLSVAPAVQGRGCGTALIEVLEEKLISLGCPKLNLQVRTENKAVIQFYQSQGYVVDDAISLGKRLIADDASA